MMEGVLAATVGIGQGRLDGAGAGVTETDGGLEGGRASFWMEGEATGVDAEALWAGEEDAVTAFAGGPEEIGGWGGGGGPVGLTASPTSASRRLLTPREVVLLSFSPI